jgi:hypothetical protein
LLGLNLPTPPGVAFAAPGAMTTLHDLREFARERLDDFPERLHQRAISGDGSPQWSREFMAWLTGSPFAVKTVETREPCDHSGTDAGSCSSCAVFADDGSILSSTGQRVKRSVLYKHPARAALARLAKLPVPPGFPALDQTVILSTRSGFSVPHLVMLFPALSGDDRALRHVVVALRRFRAVYTAEPPVRWHRRLRTDCD